MSASRSGNTADFVRIMGPVARAIMGEPNPLLSSKTELRFGTRGSLSVDLIRGIWFDHEADEGGGVIDFVRKKKGTDLAGAVQWLKDESLWPKDERASDGSWPRIVATYNYTDASGKLQFQVVRYEPKKFNQRSPDGTGGWKWEMIGVQRVLYRLPQTLAAIAAERTIYIVEGEKSADALAALGMEATCSPGGAGNWRSHYGEALARAHVVILPDNDPPGQDHAAKVAKHLQSIAASLRVVMLPDLPPKGDVIDWLAAGGTREALEAMGNTEALTPPPDTTSEQTAREAQPKSNAEMTNYEAGIRAVVDRFNKQFMMVNEAGKAVIFQAGYDPVLKRRRFDRLTLRDLQTLYMNETVAIGENYTKQVVRKPVAQVWLHHQDRHQYVQGVTFDPSTTEPIPGVLNLWEGFAVKPAPGDWSLMRSHIQSILCDSDKVRFAYLMGWMARMFQRPAEQGEVAVVMKGGEGAGKGTLAKALMRLLGHHGFAISNSKHLVGNFNAHLRDVVFLFADEAFFAGDRAAVGVLKSLITEPYLTVEGKFQNAFQAPNFLHVMMASNEDWVVPAAQDARRFFVLEVSEMVKGNDAHFAAIWKQMEAGGFEAMLHDLLQMDISTFNIRSVPDTEGLQRQKKLSLPTTEAWWMDCLQRGHVFRSKLGLEASFAVWHSAISTELLFTSYLEFAKSRGERRILTREDLGRFFVSLKATACRWRKGIVGEHLSDNGGVTRKAQTVIAERTTGYKLGSVGEARAAYSRLTGLSVTWEDGKRPDDYDEWKL